MKIQVFLFFLVVMLGLMSFLLYQDLLSQRAWSLIFDLISIQFGGFTANESDEFFQPFSQPLFVHGLQVGSYCYRNILKTFLKVHLQLLFLERIYSFGQNLPITLQHYPIRKLYYILGPFLLKSNTIFFHLWRPMPFIGTLRLVGY